MSEPMNLSSGMIYEPKTFGVLRRHQLRGIGYAEILRELFASIFHSERDFEFHTQAQRLYTYNDEAGVLLYKLMGFQLLPSYPSINKDGTTWSILSLEPETMMESLKNPDKLRQRLPEQFIDSFVNSMNRTIESQ